MVTCWSGGARPSSTSWTSAPWRRGATRPGRRGGVRVAGVTRVERGKLRRDVFDAITNMTRQPVMVGLDLKCEIAANNVARERMQQMCDQYGWDLVAPVSFEIIRYSEQVLRQRLSEIPDGSWSSDGVIQTSDTWKVTLN